MINCILQKGKSYGRIYTQERKVQANEELNFPYESKTEKRYTKKATTCKNPDLKVNNPQKKVRSNEQIIVSKVTIYPKNKT